MKALMTVAAVLVAVTACRNPLSALLHAKNPGTVTNSFYTNPNNAAVIVESAQGDLHCALGNYIIGEKSQIAGELNVMRSLELIRLRAAYPQPGRRRLRDRDVSFRRWRPPVSGVCYAALDGSATPRTRRTRRCSRSVHDWRCRSSRHLARLSPRPTLVVTPDCCWVKPCARPRSTVVRPSRVRNCGPSPDSEFTLAISVVAQAAHADFLGTVSGPRRPRPGAHQPGETNPTSSRWSLMLSRRRAQMRRRCRPGLFGTPGLRPRIRATPILLGRVDHVLSVHLYSRHLLAPDVRWRGGPSRVVELHRHVRP